MITAPELFAAMDAMDELEKRERRLRRRLRKRDCRLVIQGMGPDISYLAVSRTTASAEYGPASLDGMEGWAQ